MGNAQGSSHLWLDGKRIVDFLLVITELFPLVLTAEALLSEICRNRRFLKGWVTLSANFGVAQIKSILRDPPGYAYKSDIFILFGLEVFH